MRTSGKKHRFVEKKAKDMSTIDGCYFALALIENGGLYS